MVTLFKVLFRVFLLILLFSLLFGSYFDASRFLNNLCFPVYNSKAATIDKIKTEGLQLKSKKEIITICQQLANQNTQLNLKMQSFFDLEQRLQSLEKLLRIGDYPNFKKVYAKIIQRDISAWQHRIIVNKGALDGIKENTVLVANCGVVGKVDKVFDSYSFAELISSPRLKMAVRIEQFATPILFSGGTKSCNEYIGELKNIPLNLENFIVPGTRIISSSLTSNSTDGLTIGYVKNLYRNADGMFLSAEISLSPELNELSEVIALIKEHDLQNP